MTLGVSTLPITASRCSPGTTSRSNSSRLPARSVCWFDRPVTLPPGRARLATIPVPTGSPAAAKTIGISDVAFFSGERSRRSTRRDDDIDLEADKLGGELRVAFLASLRPTIFDGHVAAVDPAELAHALQKSVERTRSRWSAWSRPGTQSSATCRAVVRTRAMAKASQPMLQRAATRRTRAGVSRRPAQTGALARSIGFRNLSRHLLRRSSRCNFFARGTSFENDVSLIR